MTSRKLLIVNADDFGQSSGVNRGIVTAHRMGIVTSTSVMVRWPAVEEAVALARSCPRLSLGLHIDLGEWIYQSGNWLPTYEVVPLDDPSAVAGEICRQLDRFRQLTGTDPTHLDSHQHVHRRETLCEVVRAIAAQLAIPLRHESDAIRYCGDFYGQTETGERLLERIRPKHLVRVLQSLPAGITELACHPGEVPDVEGMYGYERTVELDSLCDIRVRQVLEEEGIELVSFADLNAQRRIHDAT